MVKIVRFRAHRFLLLPFFLLSFSMTASDTTAPQKPDFLERVIQANEGDYQDPLGLTLEGTIKATAFSTALYTLKDYVSYAFDPSFLNPDYMEAGWFWIRKMDDEDDHYILQNGWAKTKERLSITKENAHVAKNAAAPVATAYLSYAAVRAATKEITGYDAALLVKDSVQAVAAQTASHYVDSEIPLMNNNQIASYVATDLTVAASMYVYKEMTGKNLRCPELPIPTALRGEYINETNIGIAIYYIAKDALRIHVMNKLCGVPAAS